MCKYAISKCYWDPQDCIYYWILFECALLIVYTLHIVAGTCYAALFVPISGSVQCLLVVWLFSQHGVPHLASCEMTALVGNWGMEWNAQLKQECLLMGEE